MIGKAGMSRFNKTKAAPKHTKQRAKKRAETTESSAATSSVTNEDGNDLANTNKEEATDG